MMIIANKIKMFLADEQGAETVEWVMIAGILAVIIGIVYNGTLLTALNTSMTTLATAVTAAPSTTG